jgi:NAD(P)-dependent dehydrogenase (short-subunit alcohol dehydrogenase family)
MSKRPLLLVTGGGRGIGAAICIKAANAGYDVVINYRSDHAAAEVVSETVRQTGARVLVLAGNMAKEADIAALFKVIDEFGTLTHVVNNAGITGKANRLVDCDPQVIRETIDLNVTGCRPASAARAVLSSTSLLLLPRSALPASSFGMPPLRLPSTA